MNQDISSRAMLVNLSISRWTARKHDKRATATVERTYQTSESGRFNKVLVAKSALEAIDQAAGAARTYHYAQTLPWSDEGSRLLPSANFATYSAEMRRLRAVFEQAADDFAVNYRQFVDDARCRLNGLFDSRDYPSDIRPRFAFETTILPVPSASDFRVDLSAQETARIQADIETRVNSAVQAAHRDLYTRLGDCVSHLAEKLGEDSAVFRDSLLENLRELLEVLPRLNLTDDPALTQLKADCERKLLRYSPDTLRENNTCRHRVERDADSILAAMEGMYAPAS